MVEAYANYLQARVAFYKQDRQTIVSDFKKGISDINHIGFSLLLLKDQSVEIKKLLLDEVISIAVNGSVRDLKPARDVLSQIPSTDLQPRLNQKVDELIQQFSKDEFIDLIYRNVVMMYKALNLKDELENFICKYCRDDDNEAVREIFAEYYTQED